MIFYNTFPQLSPRFWKMRMTLLSKIHEFLSETATVSFENLFLSVTVHGHHTNVGTRRMTFRKLSEQLVQLQMIQEGFPTYLFSRKSVTSHKLGMETPESHPQ